MERERDGKNRVWGHPTGFGSGGTIHTEGLLGLFPQYSLTEKTHAHTDKHSSQIRLESSSFSLY